MKTTGIRKRKAVRNHRLLELAMADKTLSSTAKCVLVVLLFRFMNSKTGLCNPSFDAIAKAIGRSRRAIVPAVQELRDEKWLTYESTLGGSSRNTDRLAFAFDRVPVKKTAPLRGEEYFTSEEDFTGEENVVRGEEDCTRTTEEPPAVRRGGSSNPSSRGARPSGRAPRWGGKEAPNWDDLAKTFGEAK